MLERMTKDGWKPVIRDLGVNSDEAALILEMLEEKISGRVSQYTPLYKEIKRKVDGLRF